MPKANIFEEYADLFEAEDIEGSEISHNLDNSCKLNFKSSSMLILSDVLPIFLKKTFKSASIFSKLFLF